MIDHYNIHSDEVPYKRIRGDDARGIPQSGHQVERDLLGRMGKLESFQRDDHAHRMRDTRDQKRINDGLREDIGHLKGRVKEDLASMREKMRELRGGNEPRGGREPLLAKIEEAKRATREVKFSAERRLTSLEAAVTTAPAPALDEAALEAAFYKLFRERLENAVDARIDTWLGSMQLSEKIEASVVAGLAETPSMQAAAARAFDEETERRRKMTLNAINAKKRATREKNLLAKLTSLSGAAGAPTGDAESVASTIEAVA